MRKNHIKKQPKDMKQRELVTLRREKQVIVDKVLDLLRAYEADRGTTRAEYRLRNVLVRWGILDSAYGELPAPKGRQLPVPKAFTAAEIAEQEALFAAQEASDVEIEKLLREELRSLSSRRRILSKR